MEKKRKTGLKIFGKIVLSLIIILIIIIASIVGYAYNKLSKIQKIELKTEELNIDTEVEQKLTGFRNIALFGIDSRSVEDYSTGNRSDCIIIASINNDTKEVKLASVYRDTYLQIDGYGLDKVTHAYSYGEAPLAIKTLNKNLDLNITEFATVNFDLVAEVVEALGGIELTIESSELQYINDYIDATSSSTGIKSSHITRTGKQKVDGVQAVAYSRIRYTSGGDHKRTERMRDVLEAMLRKLKTKSISEINTLMDTILPKVYTNITAGDIIAMVPDILKYNIKLNVTSNTINTVEQPEQILHTLTSSGNSNGGTLVNLESTSAPITSIIIGSGGIDGYETHEYEYAVSLNNANVIIKYIN